MALGKLRCRRDAVGQEGFTLGAAMTTSRLPGMQGPGPRAPRSAKHVVAARRPGAGTPSQPGAHGPGVSQESWGRAEGSALQQRNGRPGHSGDWPGRRGSCSVASGLPTPDAHRALCPCWAWLLR